MLPKVGHIAVHAAEWLPFVLFGMVAYAKGEAVGFFAGDRPDWQKRTATVVATLAIASTLGLAFLGAASFTTHLRQLPGIVAEHVEAGPLPEIRALAERALAGNDSILNLLKDDICERNTVPSTRCDFWLANGRPDNLRRRE